VDSVTTDWPVHSVRDDAARGSVTLINSDVVDQVTLTAGAYPQTVPRTGAWWIFSYARSRERLQAHGSLSASASLILEGPVGRNRQGSWLVATRQSFVHWILKRMKAADTTAFGFTDIQTKGVYDVTPTQRVEATLIAGRSLLDLTRIDTDPNLVSAGDSKAFLLTGAWRATLGSTWTMTHRLLASRHSFDNQRRDGIQLGLGTGNGLAYRGAVSWMGRPSDLIQIGTYLQRDSMDQSMTRLVERWAPAAIVARSQDVRGSRVMGSADARLTHTGARGLALDAGVLLSHAATTARPLAVAMVWGGDTHVRYVVFAHSRRRVSAASDPRSERRHIRACRCSRGDRPASGSRARTPLAHRSRPGHGVPAP
jgi:hypothetical protein